jgi:threonine/homoserine/homoserine lactone efflux protein
VTLSQILASAFVIGFSGAVVPGPLFTVALAEAALIGWWAGPLVSLGHGLAELVAAVLLGAGVTALQSPLATKTIAIGGGLVLLWMGAATCRRRPGRTIGPTPEMSRRRWAHLNAVGSGFLATVANPFWYLWWMTAGTAHITLSLPLGSAGVGAFYVGHVASDFAWYSLVAAVVVVSRRTFSDRVYRAVIVAAGLVLMAFGVAFIVYGVLRGGSVT